MELYVVFSTTFIAAVKFPFLETWVKSLGNENKILEAWNKAPDAIKMAVASSTGLIRRDSSWPAEYFTFWPNLKNLNQN